MYSQFKDQNSFFRCLITSFKKIGGVPQSILFDNMKTAATITKSGKHINRQLQRFAVDFMFEPRLCQSRHAYTKGKVEARNKILDWIRAYDYEFEDEKELIQLIEKINIKMNQYICQGTGISPMLLYQKEMKYLHALPPISIQESYQASHKMLVGKDSLLYYRGNRYSVDPSYIGHQVGIEEIEDKIYIYYNEKIISVHEKIEGKKKIKYHEEDYRKLLKPHYHGEDLDQLVNDNLKKLDELIGE